MAKTQTKKEEPLEKVLWATANKLRKNIDAAEYKHVVLGLIFLRYISEAFENLYTKLEEGNQLCLFGCCLNDSSVSNVSGEGISHSIVPFA